jgi:hypothetical protein
VEITRWEWRLAMPRVEGVEMTSGTIDKYVTCLATSSPLAFYAMRFASLDCLTSRSCNTVSATTHRRKHYAGL